MPTEMMKKVARGIAQADERNGSPPYEMRVKNKHSREMLFDEAQAAIEALREPTLAMITAAGYLYTPAHWKEEDVFITVWMKSHDWPRMIDAALGGGK